MQHMCFVFCLSKFVSIPIITENLFADDIVHLDIACNHASRVVYHSLIKNYPREFMQCLTGANIPLRRGSLDWLAGRCLPLLSAQLSNSFLDSLRVDNLTSNSIETDLSRSTGLISACSQLRSLSMHSCLPGRSSHLMEVLKQCGQLEEISLSECSEANSVVGCLVSHCPRLRVCKVGTDVEIDHDVAITLARQCLALEELHVYVTSTDMALVNALVVGCRRLRALQLKYSHRADKDVDDVQREVEVLLCHLRGLRSIDYCPHLTSGFAYSEQNDLRRALLLAGGALTHADLYFNNEIQQSIRQTLNVSCPHLTSVDIKHCLVHNMDFLRHFLHRAMRCIRVKFMYIGEPDETELIAQEASELRELHLERLPSFGDEEEDEDEDDPDGENAQSVVVNVAALGTRCPRLTALSLVNMRIDNAALLSLLLCDAERLTSLDLGGNAGLTDEAATEALFRYPNLRNLGLKECGQLTDVALFSLAHHCPRLTEVDLSGCVELTDMGVATLAAGCRHLRVLRLFGCYLLTDATLFALVDHCPCLRGLDTRHCVGLSGAAVGHLLRERRHTMRALITYADQAEFVEELMTCPDVKAFG